MKFREIGFLRRAVYRWRNIIAWHSFTHGSNNKIVFVGQRVGSRIQINGNNNKVIVEKGALLLNSLIRISGNNNVVFLADNSYVSGTELWVEDNNCELSIGAGTFVGNHSHLACTEDGSRLSVGDNCMLSSHVQIRTGDSHTILDKNGVRINPAQSVSIGNHCWIGEGAKILKGVALEGDVIVSTGAIVTKAFGKHLLLGGIPAKVLKEGVSWEKERI